MLVAAVTKQFPRLDILINNVGIGELKPFEKISDHDWLKLIEVNFMSGVRLSRFYLPLMRKQKMGPYRFLLQLILREYSQQYNSLLLPQNHPDLASPRFN